MMQEYPCSKCIKRHVNCHATCDAYISAKQQNTMESMAINARRMEDKAMSDVSREGYMRMTKGHKDGNRVIRSRKK